MLVLDWFGILRWWKSLLTTKKLQNFVTCKPTSSHLRWDTGCYWHIYWDFKSFEYFWSFLEETDAEQNLNAVNQNTKRQLSAKHRLTNMNCGSCPKFSIISATASAQPLKRFDGVSCASPRASSTSSLNETFYGILYKCSMEVMTMSMSYGQWQWIDYNQPAALHWYSWLLVRGYQSPVTSRRL